MPRTVPNQRVVKVHRERTERDFLGIKNSNWQAAARDLGAHALLLYLYLAANADGYDLALSPVAIAEEIGMSSSTYRDQFTKLVEHGYLVRQSENSNIYHFYEVSQNEKPTENSNTAELICKTPAVFGETPTVSVNTGNIREINNNREFTDSYRYGGEKQVSPTPEGIFIF